MHAFYDVLRGFDSAFGHLKLFNFFFLDTSHFIVRVRVRVRVGVREQF